MSEFSFEGSATHIGRSYSRHLHNVLCVISFLFCASSLAAASESPGMKSPWPAASEQSVSADTRVIRLSSHREDDAGLFLSPLAVPFIIYHRYLSALDGRDCPCLPSCTAYSRDAIRRCGPLTGVLLSIDRLIRESDEIVSGDRLITERGIFCHDPLEENIAWLASPHDPPGFVSRD